MENARHLNLRGQQVVVLHPPDRDREDLQSHLLRIGLRTELYWPAPKHPLQAEFVMSMLGVAFEIKGSAIRIAIMETESPTDMNRLLLGKYDGVLVKPLRVSGLLSLLTHASVRADYLAQLEKRVIAQDQKIQLFRTVEKAKELIMRERNISGDEAFAALRRLAMNERRSVEDVASELMTADNVIRKLSSRVQ